jgi:REP element-mobilizing transposase RayT
MLCLPVCTVITAHITCTLSLAPVTGDCLFWALRRRETDFFPYSKETRQRYRFAVAGYVVMPEHIHLLVSEPEVGAPSTVMQVQAAHRTRPVAQA